MADDVKEETQTKTDSFGTPEKDAAGNDKTETIDKSDDSDSDSDDSDD
jgi:hypothetical protein